MNKYIGYTCSYTPVEILSATGFKPYRLLHGNAALSLKGDEMARIDACPLVKSNLGYVLQNQERFVALVGSTGCDMARRMFDIVNTETKIPVYLFNNPRTDNAQIYHDEIEWLFAELENLSGRQLTEQVIKGESEKWERIRQNLRAVDAKRAHEPSLVSTTDFHEALIRYHQGDIDERMPEVRAAVSKKPRVYLLGSPIPYEGHQLLEQIEHHMRIVGDFNCGLSRVLNIRIERNDRPGIVKAYFSQPPCIFKRPNILFYEWIIRRARELNCTGVIAYTLDYCDNYEFELKKIEQKLKLPVLRIRSDFSFQNVNQLRTRIEAFAEMLGVNG